MSVALLSSQLGGRCAADKLPAGGGCCWSQSALLRAGEALRPSRGRPDGAVGALHQEEGRGGAGGTRAVPPGGRRHPGDDRAGQEGGKYLYRQGVYVYNRTG
ncbi:MAG: hypothetical protein V8S34_06865 [Lawsonibacter sp.]